MNIRTLKAFTTQDENGEMVSFAYNTVYEVTDEIGNQLITDGLAEKDEGGGNSDFSTAKVTVNMTFQQAIPRDVTVPIYLICCNATEGMDPPAMANEAQVLCDFKAGDTSKSVEFDSVVLYKGRQHVSNCQVLMQGSPSNIPFNITSVSGNISMVGGGQTAEMTITGDGAINVNY